MFLSRYYRRIYARYARRAMGTIEVDTTIRSTDLRPTRRDIRSDIVILERDWWSSIVESCVTASGTI